MGKILDIKLKTIEKGFSRTFREFFNPHSSGSSENQKNGDSGKLSNNEQRNSNLFAYDYPRLSENQKNGDSSKLSRDGHPEKIHNQYSRGSSSSSDLIRDAYNRVIADKEVFGPARETLERFDQEVKELVNQNKEVLTEASTIGLVDGDQTGEGEILDNRIKSATRLKTELEGDMKKLLDMKEHIYGASENFFSISSEMEVYDRLQIIINEIGDHPLKQNFIRKLGGQDNFWQHIEQGKIKLIEKVDSQIETINASLEKTEEALQKATNYHRRLERQLEESQAAYKTLRQRLAEVKDNQATFNAAKATFEMSVLEVKSLMIRDGNLRMRADSLGVDDFKDGIARKGDPFNHQIRRTAEYIVGLEEHKRQLCQKQESIMSKKEKISSISFPVEYHERLQVIIERIYDNTLKQEIEQDVRKYIDICKQSGRTTLSGEQLKNSEKNELEQPYLRHLMEVYQQNNESKVKLLEEAKSQIETINASIEKTVQSWQRAKDYYRQLKEGQTAYKTLQGRLAEGQKKLRNSQVTFYGANTALALSAYNVKELENQSNVAHQRAEWLGSHLLKDITGKAVPLGDQIRSTAKLKDELEGYMKNLQKEQLNIIRWKNEIDFIKLGIVYYDKLEQEISKITIKSVKQDVERDFHKHNDSCRQIEEGVLKLQAKAESQIETINASIEKTKEALPKATNYLCQLEESQPLYDTLQQQLGERQKELDTNKAIRDATEATLERFAPMIRDLERWLLLKHGGLRENMANQLANWIKAEREAPTRNVETMSNEINAIINKLEDRLGNLHKMQKNYN